MEQESEDAIEEDDETTAAEDPAGFDDSTLYTTASTSRPHTTSREGDDEDTTEDNDDSGNLLNIKNVPIIIIIGRSSDHTEAEKKKATVLQQARKAQRIFQEIQILSIAGPGEDRQEAPERLLQEGDQGPSDEDNRDGNRAHNYGGDAGFKQLTDNCKKS